MAFECLKRLYKEELYSNVAYLGSLLVTTIDRSPDYLTPVNRYQACVYYADALAYLKQNRRAESMYMKALSMRKSPNFNNKSPGGYESTKKNAANNCSDVTSETEVKYRLHLCLVKQSKLKEAVGLLESITTKQRNAKINAALADLYKKLNLVLSAAQAYKDFLASCPVALGAIVELLNLGVTVKDIETAASESGVDLTDSFGTDWFPSWLAGTASYARHEYFSAVGSFYELDTKTSLANNPSILCHLALSYYHAGEHNKACATLQRVHTLDPLHVECMDILAALLCEDKRIKELESLATQLMLTSAESRQSWVAMGYLCRALKKLPKSLYFAHKACADAKSHPYVEAMLLKGLVLMDLKKFSEATVHFQEALQSNVYRYELYEGLVNCHLERSKLKEARAAAALCLKQMGQTARGLTLFASVLSKDPSTLGEAQAMLERAVETAPYLLNAVYLLVSIYDRQRQYDKAVELLKRQTSRCVNSKLHGMLGEFLSKSTLYSQAMDSYRYALTLDPTDEISLAGINEFATNGGGHQQQQGGGGAGLSSTIGRPWDQSGRSSVHLPASTMANLAAGDSAPSSSHITAVATPEVMIGAANAHPIPPNAPIRPSRVTVATFPDVTLSSFLDVEGATANGPGDISMEQ